jgi:uncharacterized protein with PIN domain
VEPFWARLRFHGDLDFFIKRGADARQLERQLTEPTSVKDAIESCGVPHPEVDRILVDNLPVEFRYVLRNNSEVDVYPVGFSETVAGQPLQRRHADRFVADGHLGKLTRNLRFLGLDVAYDNQMQDPDLLRVMETEQRVLLTRDRRLLMHAVVSDGYCPRSSDPTEQTVEVVRRFDLGRDLKPFTRCIQCNSTVEQIDKASVLGQLEPLTRVYYEEFRRCTGCGKIFWRGSHFAKLEGFLERLKARLAQKSLRDHGD